MTLNFNLVLCVKSVIAVCFYDLQTSRQTLKVWTLCCSAFLVPGYREVLRETKDFKTLVIFLAWWSLLTNGFWLYFREVHSFFGRIIDCDSFSVQLDSTLPGLGFSFI